ncbi:MAG: hypothetical protein ACLRMZ_11730 [Blautia marasmi]
MLSQLPGGMMICRRDDRYSTKWISDTLSHLLGYIGAEEYVEFTGNCCRGFIVPEDYAAMQVQAEESLREGISTMWNTGFSERTALVLGIGYGEKGY